MPQKRLYPSRSQDHYPLSPVYRVTGSSPRILKFSRYLPSSMNSPTVFTSRLE